MTVVNKDIIKGSLGPAIVVIPEARILSTCWTYKMEENAFVDNKTKYRIEKDTKLRCKVIEVHIDMNYQMKIVASLEEEGLGPIE